MIKAGSASDTLTGADATSTWNLGAIQNYKLTNTLTFSGYETLQGGTGGRHVQREREHHHGPQGRSRRGRLCDQRWR